MSKKKGFSLIELLVVIGIIVLLISIIVPVTQKVRRKAKALICQTNLKQWGTTIALYSNNNSGKFPGDVGGLLWLMRGTCTNRNSSSSQTSQQEKTAKSIAYCPMAKAVGRVAERHIVDSGGILDNFGTGPFIFTISLGAEFRAWEITSPPPEYSSSYGWNGALFDFIAKTSYFEKPTTFINIDSLKNRSHTPILLDSADIIGEMDTSFVWGPTSIGTVISERLYSRNNNSFLINRHDGYINGLFLDWSVRKIGLKELWTLKWSDDFDTSNRWTKAGGVKSEDWPEWMRGFKDY